jgi:uncharacterized damage-inducible protein DinB
MRELSESLLAKIEEQMERAQHLARLIPAGRIDWVPPIEGAWTMGALLGHLLDCAAGFSAALHAARPQKLAHFLKLREMPVNSPAAPDAFEALLGQFRSHIQEGFEGLEDADLSRRIPTLFVPEGETLLTILLGNLEHFINHKRELFVYLKMMGVPVSTRDLYRLRGEQ